MWGHAPASGNRGKMSHIVPMTSSPPCSTDFLSSALPKPCLSCPAAGQDLVSSKSSSFPQELHGPPKQAGLVLGHGGAGSAGEDGVGMQGGTHRRWDRSQRWC